MARTTVWLVWLIGVLVMALLPAACDCGDDDDDDHGGSPADDDADDDAADDDTADDDADDDTSVEPLPTVNCIPPVDYDGDGENELLLQTIDSTTLSIYLAEPGTFERELILELPLTKQGGPHLEVTDFDDNHVFDLVWATVDFTAKGIYTTYEIFLNGDFDDPIATLGPFASYPAEIMVDADNDGLPEMLVPTIEEDYAPTQYRLYDFDGTTLVPGAVFEAPAGYTLTMLHHQRTGDWYESAANLTGTSGAAELLGIYAWEDSGHYYAQMLAFDSATGAVNADSDPIDFYATVPTNSFFAGEIDGDGLSEIVLDLEYRSSDKAVLQSQFFVYGGADFTAEYTSGLYVDYYSYQFWFEDLNTDGAFDPLFVRHTGSSAGAIYVAVDGADAYNELLHFTAPDDSLNDIALRPGRGYVGLGYDITGNGLEVLTFRSVKSGATATGEIESIPIGGGAASGALLTYPLGEQGTLNACVTDFGNDGNLELAVLTAALTWNGAEWVYDNDLFVHAGAGLTQIFAYDMGTAPGLQLNCEYDLTGDWGPDLVVEEITAGGNQQHLFTCAAGGCEFVETISFGADESFFFLGPML